MHAQSNYAIEPQDKGLYRVVDLRTGKAVKDLPHGPAECLLDMIRKLERTPRHHDCTWPRCGVCANVGPIG